MAKKRSSKKKKVELDHDVVVEVADDMNSALGLDPEIDTDEETDDIMDRIKTESKELYSDDSLEDDTWEFLEEHCGVVKDDLSAYQEEDSGPEEEEEVEPEEPEKKKKAGTKSGKKKDSKKTAGNKEEKSKTKKADPIKRVGIIDTIMKSITKKAMDRAEILEVLTDKFPDRSEEAMKKTIACQVPYQLTKNKGLDVVKLKNGKWKINK